MADNSEPEDMSGSELGDMMMDGSQQFWSLTVKPGVDIDLEEPPFDAIINVTTVTFGLTVSKGSRSVLMCKSMEMEDFVPLCILRQDSCETMKVDLRFDGPATFQVKGKNASTITMNGFLMPRKMAGGMGGLDEDLEEDKDEDMGVDGDNEEDEDEEVENGMGEDEEDEENEPAKGEDSEEEDSEEEEEAPKKQQKKGKEEAGKKRKPAENNEPPTKKAKEAGKKGMTTMKSGIQYRDMKVGSGKPLKNGHKVSVKYVGQLEDNSVFDKCLTSDGFKFVLGKGEVIKGWDLGLKGTKVGTKRKLVIPPQFAYGNKGMEPKIPPNAALTFTIEVCAAE